MQDFTPQLNPSVRYFAKGPWYVAAAIYETTGCFEAGKCGTVLAWAAMGLAVFAAGLDAGLRRRFAAVTALVAALNPVVMCELTTCMVDGIMVAFLTVVVAALFSVFLRPQPVVIWVGCLAAIFWHLSSQRAGSGVCSGGASGCSPTAGGWGWQSSWARWYSVIIRM
jgi:hypothetical protein